MKLPRLAAGDVRLEPLDRRHREPLRAACAEDQTIWDIYSYSMLGDGFDSWWARAMDPAPAGHFWAVEAGGRLAGCTGIFPDERAPGVVEAGGTYLAPWARGTAINRTMKWLLLSWLFDSGFHRVEFRVDGRNLRSQAAVLKLGASRDGVLRRHKVTHTGFVRDTHVFSITDLDWPGLEPALRPDGDHA
ncbi:MAG: GNAT family N-acetyltransferase [Sphingomonadaceae bacterium]